MSYSTTTITVEYADREMEYQSIWAAAEATNVKYTTFRRWLHQGLSENAKDKGIVGLRIDGTPCVPAFKPGRLVEVVFDDGSVKEYESFKAAADDLGVAYQVVTNFRAVSGLGIRSIHEIVKGELK